MFNNLHTPLIILVYRAHTFILVTRPCGLGHGFTANLMKLSQNEQGWPAHHCLTWTTTPLRLSTWKQKLMLHPNQDFISYILKGIEQEFPIAVDRTEQTVPALQNSQVVEDYLLAEVVKGNIRWASCWSVPVPPNKPIWSHPNEAPTKV